MIQNISGKKRDHLECVDIVGGIMLKRILRR